MKQYLCAGAALMALTAPGLPAPVLADAAQTFRVLCLFVLLLGLSFGLDKVV